MNCGYERIHSGHDDAAVKYIAHARALVTGLRDRYPYGAPKAIHPAAAQEIRDLAERLKRIGKQSGNATAARNLSHESGRLNNFLATTGFVIGSDMTYRFRV
jgi:hypothetical protein